MQRFDAIQQDWGDAWVLGEGETMAATAQASQEAAPVGTRAPELVVDRERTVHRVLYPITDIEASVRTALETVRRLA